MTTSEVGPRITKTWLLTSNICKCAVYIAASFNLKRVENEGQCLGPYLTQLMQPLFSDPDFVSNLSLRGIPFSSLPTAPFLPSEISS